MKVLAIDLNNFSRYPTLSIGYIAAILRKNDIEVDVLSPFSFGVHGFPRNVREKPWQLYVNFLSHWAAVTEVPLVKKLRHRLKRQLQPGNEGDSKIIADSVTGMLEHNPQVVLISAYTMYLDVCKQIADLCQARAIPVIVGGNSFVVKDVADVWAKIPGMSAIYAGEPEFVLADIVRKLAQQEDVSGYAGVYTPNKILDRVATPISNLDAVPFPDFSDFPWDSYPNRIVPIMTGRGCGWGLCTFCSDVLTSAGRTFRSRSLDNVLQEIAFQRARFDVDLFVFLDLKLNSDLHVWRGLAEQLPQVAPGIKWTASVHVDSRPDNGLSHEDLRKAANAGLVRITCGLESASRTVLSRMAKGVRINRMRDYIVAAYDAGISVRLTCIVGFPDEDAADIDMTTEFLEENSQYLERISLNRFANIPGTPVQELLANSPETYPHIKVHDLDLETAIIPHDNSRFTQHRNLAAIFRLQKVVNRINQKPLLENAIEFEGAF